MAVHRESCQVRYRGGIHNGTLEGLAPLGALGLRVDGVDPGDPANWRALIEHNRDGSAEVELIVDHPDPETARDIATIARRTIWQGRELWPGRELLLDQVPAAAKAIRDHEASLGESPSGSV